MKHGRAQMAFGKYKGVRVRLLPDDYLSFLTTLPMLQEERWRWLWDSVIAELKFRELRYDLAHTEDPAEDSGPGEPHKRKFRFPTESSPTLRLFS